MQPTNRVSGFEVANNADYEAPDVFCGLASLIVEGRLPRNDGRGYGEGTHVPIGTKGPRHHVCSEENTMCKKDENLRKHMLLLWQNNVPVSIEVLLCSDCRVSQQKVRSIEFSTIPEPGSILLEQWTVSIQNLQLCDYLITSHGLYQAVRSYLHFSQLSAWYSSSRGQEPNNVLYRITIPGEAFASKFSCKPEEHYFPSANVGRASSVHVSVRSLPRCEEVPRVTCPHNVVSTPHQEYSPLSPITSSSSGSSEVLSPHAASPIPSSSSSTEDQPGTVQDENKLSMAGALEWRDNSSCSTCSHETESNLRKTLVKSRLQQVECQAEKLPRSDSLDSMLGDSLLDPPQSLQKIPPKRYQSPSRCGSPSLEAPDHLLFGNSGDSSTGSSIDSAQQSRLARQDLLRRRDINLYTGLHPRLLHGTQQPQTMPRLSLFSSKQPQQPSYQPRTPCRAFPSPHQMPTPTSLPLRPSLPLRWEHNNNLMTSTEINLGAKQKKSLKMVPPPEDEVNEDCDDLEAEDGILPIELEALELKSNCSSRRSSLKDEDSLFPHKCKKSKSKTLEEILGIQPESGLFESEAVTRVYRAEIPPLPQNPTTSPIPPSTAEANNNKILKVASNPEEAASASLLAAGSPPVASNTPLSKSDILLGAIIRTCERNLDKTPPPSSTSGPAPPNNNNSTRLRSLSENVKQDLKQHLEPLDMSFDTTKDSSEDDEDDEDDEEEVVVTSRRSSFSSDGCYVVPTPDECASFRQSFDSATSMVFHRKTGLPLTSSPAPLRRGTDKFDYDDSINSPHDIKKALFAKKSLKYESENSPIMACVGGHPKKAKKLRSSLIEENIENKENVIDTIKTQSIRQRRPSKKLLSASAPATLTSNNLLGNFEESVLNGRLEPNSTVEGFTAEIGASGAFQPKHRTLPVTVFFYTLCDNAAYSSPYLGHINLGKKGYRVPSKGTIQVTLFNPLGTVVKMFVVMYDLSDMPPNSQTFLRQRTLYMPSEGVNEGDLQKWLRYLVHLRFASSKTGKIYLHTDIRMIIFRKSDLDTAADFTSSKGFELRSFTQGPSNPKFSPRR